MVNKIKFKEPESSDYIFIDKNNKVHLLMPIVGGDEIGLDNTCKTGLEIQSFFFGSKGRKSAEENLIEYQKGLQSDIAAIKAEKKAHSSEAYEDLLKEKEERLAQITKYIELVRDVKSQQYDNKKEIARLKGATYPKPPEAVQNIVKESPNGAAVRLSPREPDQLTLLDNPIFGLNRPTGWGNRAVLVDGLGKRLFETFAPTESQKITINKKSQKERVIEAILNRVNESQMKDTNPGDLSDRFGELRTIIQEELKTVNPDFSLENITLDYVQAILAYEADDPIEDWVEGTIDCAITEDAWQLSEPSDDASVFYDGTKEISSEKIADKMSIKVQFLLAEINIFCKKEGLSTEDFGPFFDKEPHATQIAERVKNGLMNGADIEPIIFKYINEHQNELGLDAPLSKEQQTEINKKFSQHYFTIKDSPHFDEFFIVDPDKQGNIFAHQGRISCHFLDFFSRQVNTEYDLGVLEGNKDALSNQTSNRLNHKNDVYGSLEQFNATVVGYLKENKAKELVDFLLTETPAGVPNYSMLSLETQSYIAYNRNWPAIERELKNPERNVPPKMKDDLERLLSRDHIKHEQLSAVTWSKVSAKPLLEVKLGTIGTGLKATVTQYNEKRSWFKGKKNKARERQCQELSDVADQINELIEKGEKGTFTKREVLEKLLKSIDTLDRIDKEISQERNLFKSSLQSEVQNFRRELNELCDLDNYAFKSTDIDEIVSFEMEERFGKIKDSEVQAIVRDLPFHYQTNEAIDLFTTLNAEEASKVASYLHLEYREIDSKINKTKLLEQDIPKLFKEVNTQLLDKLKEDQVINEDVYQKLEKLADKIPPELCTRSNIEKWSLNVEKLEESKLDDLLTTARREQETPVCSTRSFRESMRELSGRNEHGPSDSPSLST